MRARLLIVVAIVLAASASRAQTPVEAARALVGRYHEDARVLDRARDLLDAALARDRQGETVGMLSYVPFLLGEISATPADEELPPHDPGPPPGKGGREPAAK